MQLATLMRGIGALLCLVTLVACENAVRFETPQPEGQKDEVGIPLRLMGSYLSLGDSSRLDVGRDVIVRTSNFDYTTLLSQLDSIDRPALKGDTTFRQGDSSLSLRAVVRGDSVFVHINQVDTLFSISKGDVLRKFKGYYFLNTESWLGGWNVSKLGTIRNGLVIGTVWNSDDLETLRELTDSGDSVYLFKPKKREFRKLIRDNGFRSEERFIKI